MNGAGDPLAVAPEVSREALLDILDRTVSDHLDWLQSWHHSVLVAAPADRRPPDPHRLCLFGAWYVRNQHAELVNQPMVARLAALHEELHERGQALAARAATGTTPSPTDYDAFADGFNTFISLARRLEKAFAAASSELDPLTGVHNRQAMASELDREFERFRRTGRPFCVVLTDLDHFKAINDSHGHAAGDIVLRATAARLLASLRRYDGVYRYGGEEFLLFLSDIGADAAAGIIERLRESLAAEVIDLDGERRVTITASFGLAETVSGDRTTEDTIKRADKALYRAKEGGRNQLVIAD